MPTEDPLRKRIGPRENLVVEGRAQEARALVAEVHKCVRNGTNLRLSLSSAPRSAECQFSPGRAHEENIERGGRARLLGLSMGSKPVTGNSHAAKAERERAEVVLLLCRVANGVLDVSECVAGMS